MGHQINTILCLALVANIYTGVQADGKGRQKIIEDAEKVATASYDPNWTPKPHGWDWRASFEREWLEKQQTFLQAKKLITPPHMRKFKYFSPTYYKADLKALNQAKFTEELTRESKYPTYPTLPPGFSHTYLNFEDILGPNPYNWSKETYDYANNVEKCEQLYDLQQKELQGRRNKTVLKHLYNEWLKVDPLRKNLRGKRNVRNEPEMETCERKMFKEYEEFKQNFSDYMEEKERAKKQTTQGIMIKEERYKRDVTNDRMGSEEKLKKNFSIYMEEKKRANKHATQGIIINEERNTGDATDCDMETGERQIFMEYEEFKKNMSDYMEEKDRAKKHTTQGIMIEEKRYKRDIYRKDEISGPSRKHVQKSTSHVIETEPDMYGEYEEFLKQGKEYIEQRYKRKGKTINLEQNSPKRRTQPHHTIKKDGATKTIVIKDEEDIFDDMGTLEDLPKKWQWNSTILDDLGSNWEGATEGRVDWKAMRDERLKNAEDVDFRNMSWHEIRTKYGLPLYSTRYPPLNDSMKKTVDPDKYNKDYDMMFPGRIVNLDNITIVPFFTLNPNITPVPDHLTKLVPYHQYDDFYKMMFKERIEHEFKWSTEIYWMRDYSTAPPLSTHIVKNDDFFKWYDEVFPGRGQKDLEGVTPHPMFCLNDRTPCPDHLTQTIDLDQAENEYDILFGDRKKYRDVTPNTAWNYLEEVALKPTDPWWTFYDSAFGDIQPRVRRGDNTKEMIEKAVNLPEQDPEPGISEEEREFNRKALEFHHQQMKKNNASQSKSREKRDLSQTKRKALDDLEMLINQPKMNARDEGHFGANILRGNEKRITPRNDVQWEINLRDNINNDILRENKVTSFQHIIGTSRPNLFGHRLVKREERTSIHLFEYLKRAKDRRNRRYRFSTTKRYRSVMFDTNDSYINFKNYMDRVNNNEISDFGYAEALYGEYIDKYMTAQFDLFKRQFTEFARKKNTTWTRRTGYTDSLGRTFTFDPNHTYVTPWEEIDVIQYISECRAMRHTTTQPTPKDFWPYTGTRERQSKMTKVLDPKWLVHFGIMSPNETIETTTSMYFKNWLKFQQKQKEPLTRLTTISVFFKNFLRSHTKIQQNPSEPTKNRFLGMLKTRPKARDKKALKTTSVFYKNFILRQNKYFVYTFLNKITEKTGSYQFNKDFYVNLSNSKTRDPTKYQFNNINKITEKSAYQFNKDFYVNLSKTKPTDPTKTQFNTDLHFNLTSKITDTTKSEFNKDVYVNQPETTKRTNITDLPPTIQHTSKLVKNFIDRYGSYAKEHMERNILRERIMGDNLHKHSFGEEIKNLSDHIERIDRESYERDIVTEWYDDSLSVTSEYNETEWQRRNQEKQEFFKRQKEKLRNKGSSYKNEDIGEVRELRRKRAIVSYINPSDEKDKYSTAQVLPKNRTEIKKEINSTKTTSIFMRNFMARTHLTSPKRRRLKITKRTSVSCRLVPITTNYYPWEMMSNMTPPYIMMHYFTGHENWTFPPIYSYTRGRDNTTWSIELEEDPFFRLKRRFFGKTKRRLTHEARLAKPKKDFETLFEEWRQMPLRPGLPSNMLSVQSKEVKEHAEFWSTMHYHKMYTERLTVIDKLMKDSSVQSYSDYEKYAPPKLRTRNSMDYENVVKHRIQKAQRLRHGNVALLDSEYIFESEQFFLDDENRKQRFTFPMGNYKTLYPRYNPYYYNRSVINTDLIVENLKSLTRNPIRLAEIENEMKRNVTERMQQYMKDNPDKKEDEVDFDDFVDSQEAVSHFYYWGLSSMKPEDAPHKNFDYIRNEYTAIDHAVFHWSIIGKKENKVQTEPWRPGKSSTTSYLQFYWKTPSTLDWQRYWKYPYTTTTTLKPTGPNWRENREYAKNLEDKLDEEARHKILADLEHLDDLITNMDFTSTSRTLVWHKNESHGKKYVTQSNLRQKYNQKSEEKHEIFTRKTVTSQEKTINYDDIIDPADISRELGRRRRRRKRDLKDTTNNSNEMVIYLTAKPLAWRIPDSVIDIIRGTTEPDDIHKTKIHFKYLENCTDSEEYLNVTLPNYMRDIYYGFSKNKIITTPKVQWSIPKKVVKMIDEGTNPIRTEAEKHIPYSIFRKKLMHMLKMKMKSYSIPFYRQRMDKTPFSLNTEEKDEIYYDTLEKHGLRFRATHNYRMATYMFPLFSNSCERFIKDMAEGYHNVYDPPGAKRLILNTEVSSTLKAGDYDGDWIKINPSDLLRFPPPTVYWPTINRNDVTYRPPWIKNSTRTRRKIKTTTPFDTESFDSQDSLIRNDWLFTTNHWNDADNINITAMQIFMDRPKGESSEFNDYCRKHGLPLDEDGKPPTDWYDSQVPSEAKLLWAKVKEHDTIAPESYSDERLGTKETYVEKKDEKKFFERLISNSTASLAEEDFNETSTMVIKSRAYLGNRFSNERYYKYDAKYLKALEEMGGPKKVAPGYKDPEYKRVEKLYESNKNNKSNIYFSNIYKTGIKPGHPLLKSSEEYINQPLSWEYKPNYTHVELEHDPGNETSTRENGTLTTTHPYTWVDLSDLLSSTDDETPKPKLSKDIHPNFLDGMVSDKNKQNRVQTDSAVFPATTVNPYTCEFITDLMSSYELRKKNIPRDAVVAHPYGRPHPYYKKVIYDRLGGYLGTTFVSLEHSKYGH